jgi:hypothetical protein
LTKICVEEKEACIADERLGGQCLVNGRGLVSAQLYGQLALAEIAST